MTTLIVTASSKSKNTKDEVPFLPPSKTFENSISMEYRKQLLQGRRNLIDELKIKPGPDIGSSKDEYFQFLPAFQRYAGRTYSRISTEAWENMSRHPDEYDCLILSALYGIVRYDEPIRNYTLKQVDKMPVQNIKVSKYWSLQGASEWVFDYVKKNDITDVKFVLSSSYSDIIKRDDLMSRLKEELSVSSEDKQLKEAGGMKAMLARGDYINSVLKGS